MSLGESAAFLFLLLLIWTFLALIFKILGRLFGSSANEEKYDYEDEDDEPHSSDPASSKMERRRIGEELELAVGGFLERRGWTVYYAGIEKGVNDGGIDLIAKRDGTTTLIQCKFWKSYRLIYEKHINQFHGAIETYRWDNPGEQVRGAFYTTARLSPEAKRAAQIHEIEVNDRYRF